MNHFAEIIARGLGVMQHVTGQTLEYRAGKSGSWIVLPTTALAAGFLTYDAPMVIGYDENRAEIIGPATARLKLPLGAPVLTPATPDQGGYYVRVGAKTVWAVTGMAEVEYAQTIYSLKREDIIEARPQQQGIV